KCRTIPDCEGLLRIREGTKGHPVDCRDNDKGSQLADNAPESDIAIQFALFGRGKEPGDVVKGHHKGQSGKRKIPTAKQKGGDAASESSNPFDCCLRHFHSPFASSLDSLFCCWRYC